MDRPTSKERLQHMLDAIQAIRKFMHEVSESVFLDDFQLQCAVQYQFLIVGEAVGQIDAEILSKYNYPWHIPKSFRNFIIHAYHNVKMERIYYATQDLDELQKLIEQILSQEFKATYRI